MFNFKAFLFAALLAGSQAATVRTSSRSLSQGLIAGYEPSTSVTDHNAIDLDQQAMEEELEKLTVDGFTNARKIYVQGGHSKSYAELTLDTDLASGASEGTVVTGKSASGTDVSGKVYKDYVASSKILLVQYSTGQDQKTYSSCQVGGLVTPNFLGCFNETGSITVGTFDVPYSYNVASGNKNGRTLFYFSDKADTKMRVNESPDGDYYPDFQKFVDYYGTPTYAREIVAAAFEKSVASLDGKQFVFGTYSDDARAEAVKKTSVYLGVAMYVIRELEDAVETCLEPDADDQDNSVDEAVAFYTGSLEGTDGSTDGVMLHALAEKRCKNFKTCGPNGDSITGNAKVNEDLFLDFARMRDNYISKKCDDARKNKESIAKKMFVPFVQGTLRYAYQQRNKEAGAGDDEESEGAIFAAAVLPVVAKCDSNAAATIYDNMQTNSDFSADFQAVKQAFESQYECMGITCADVGGLIDETTGTYAEGAAPCGSSSSSSSGVNVGLAVGLSIGGVVLVALIFLFLKRRSASNVEFKSDNNQQV